MFTLMIDAPLSPFVAKKINKISCNSEWLTVKVYSMTFSLNTEKAV